MGRRRERDPKSQAQTLPSSPAHSFSSSSSSSSSDFEFTISCSPHRPGSGGGAGGGGDSTVLCPADELFYKGQLLPLHLSPRLSMVRTLLLASSSSSDSAVSSSRNSSADTHSFADCDSSSGRPSSAAADDELPKPPLPQYPHDPHALAQANKSRHFSLARFSSVFCPKARPDPSSVKRVSATARDVIRKYLRMVKPFYEKLSSPKRQQQQKMAGFANGVVPAAAASVWGERSTERIRSGGYSHSFSGNNKRYPRMRGHVASCPSSIRSSPSHTGSLGHGGRFGPGNWGGSGDGYANGTTSSSSMEELQNAIQGAIAYCKSSMLQQPGLVSNEI